MTRPLLLFVLAVLCVLALFALFPDLQRAYDDCRQRGGWMYRGICVGAHDRSTP